MRTRAVALAFLVPTIALSCSSNAPGLGIHDLPRNNLEAAFDAGKLDSWADFARAYADRYEEELAISDCMRERGFDYVAVGAPELAMPIADIVERIERAARLGTGSAEFRREFGYGFSTIRAYLTVDRPISPNDLMLASLDVAEASAFGEALHGREELDGSESLQVRSDGCVNAATGSAGAEEPRSIDTVGPAHEEYMSRLRAWPSYVAATEQWARCARDRGYSIGSPSLISDYIDGLLSAVETLPRNFSFDLLDDPSNTSEDGVESITSDQFEAYGGSPYDRGGLDRIQRHELQLARDLFECDRSFWQATNEAAGELALQTIDRRPGLSATVEAELRRDTS